MIDLLTLGALAARSPTRRQLRAAGFLAVCASSDLQPHGYQVRHWARVRDGAEVLEYNPIVTRDWQSKEVLYASGLPRVALSSYADQAALHLALGLNLVAPGEPWRDYGGPGLFDGLLLDESACPEIIPCARA